MQIIQRTETVLAIWLFCGLAVIPALAHPPAEMLLAYDAFSDVLTVEVRHSVLKPENHTIDYVEIRYGDTREFFRYRRQDRADVFRKQYEIDVDDDEILRVRAQCHLRGLIVGTLDLSRERSSRVVNDTAY